MDIAVIGSIISVSGILASFLAAIYALNQNHKWNRRNYTAELFKEWDNKMGDHRKVIEGIWPGLLDMTNGKQKEVSRDRSIEIYSAKVDHPDWELRYRFIQVLNFYETIACAWIYHIGDRDMIERSFKTVLIKQNLMLRSFILVVNEERGYKCWEPFAEVIDRWSRQKYPDEKKTG